MYSRVKPRKSAVVVSLLILLVLFLFSGFVGYFIGKSSNKSDIQKLSDGNIELNSKVEVLSKELGMEISEKEVLSERLKGYEDKSYYISYGVPKNNSFKTYMPYDALTLKSSMQYALQTINAVTGEHGIRTVNGRYCIAVGSGYCKTIGTYIDVVMANGSILHCIMADLKDDKDTDNTNRYSYNRDIIEFVVDMSAMDKYVLDSGDMSNASKAFEGEIKEIRVYK